MKQFCAKHPRLAYTLALLAVNLLSVGLFILWYNAESSIFLQVLYYTTKILSCAVTFFTLAAVFTAWKRASFKTCVLYTLIAVILMLIPNGVSSVLPSLSNGFNLVILLSQSFLILLQYSFMYLFLSFLMRLTEDERSSFPPFFKGMKSEHRSSLVAIIAFGIVQLALELIDTVSFVIDRMGLMDFSHWIDIFLSWLFVIATFVLGYFVLLCSRRLIEHLTADNSLSENKNNGSSDRENRS